MRATHRAIAVLSVLLLTVSSGAALAAPADVDATLENAMTHAKVRGVLLERVGTDALKINIDVNGSHVRLAGEVSKSGTQQLAKEAALSVKGVHHVDNQLTVKPEGTSGAAETAKSDLKDAAEHVESELKDATLETKVKGRLLSEVGKNALDIEVEAASGVVSLSGTVPKDLKGRALSTARTTKGVRKVVDLLKT